MEPTLKIELTVNEVNAILRSLGKHPFDEIAALIGKIKAQGEAQIAEIEAAVAAAQAAQPAPANDAPAAN